MSECERGKGKETTALSRGDEEGDSSPARSWSAGWVWGKDQEEVRERQGSSTDKCNQGWPPSWCWEGKQSTTWIPPPLSANSSQHFFPRPLPHTCLTCKCSGSFLCWHHVGTHKDLQDLRWKRVYGNLQSQDQARLQHHHIIKYINANTEEIPTYHIF